MTSSVFLFFIVIILRPIRLAMSNGFFEGILEFRSHLTIDSLVWSYLFTVVVVILMTQLFKRLLNKAPSTPNWAVKYLSHFISIIFVYSANSLELINSGGVGFIYLSFFGIVAAFTAQGIFDTKIFSLFKKNK